MKTLLLLAAFVLTSLFTSAQSISINTDGSTAHPSAILDVKSDSKGALLPRITKEQRNGINPPATGLVIYQTNDTTGYWFYNGTRWTLMQDNLGNHTLNQNLVTNNRYMSTDGSNTGIRLTDSGTVRMYGIASCCFATPTIKERFKFEKDGGFYAGGELGIGVNPAEGKGYRTSWYPYKGAFRSGYADNEWNDSLTGFFSWAGGSNSTASGLYALAFGDGNFATSTSSIVFGSGNKVYGAAGFSAGAGNQVDDTYGAALGNKAFSRNEGSMALGINVVAKGYASTVVGIYNDSLLTVPDDPSSTTTPLFIVGNGTANNARSNAMVVRKNGNVEVKGLRIGGGNAVVRQQSGTFLVGSSTTGTKTMTFNFPANFSGTPKIVATPKNEVGTDYPDSFIVTVRRITSTQVTFNIIRIDTNTFWGQQLLIDWTAWE